jgi:hypothetical protein
MARIWPVYEGKTPTSGERWAELPLSDAIELFDLRKSQFVSDLTVTPRFGDTARDLTWAGFKHIVIEIAPDEANKAKWKPGFYRSASKPKEAFRRLIQHAMIAELGDKNVVRIDCDLATDSLGDDTLRVTVVLAPGATARLANAAVLDASVRLQERLREMNMYSTPIVEYATEAELAQDGGA